MARHYFESEFVPVAEVQPGVQLVHRKTVTTIVRSEVQAVVTYDDGTSQTFDLTVDPAVEVVTAGLRD
ncbi:MAG TPA: hypothetical protein VEG38_21960 [Acidimicrobiia bacterium]|nr:hypothetical protein [Acidimicrobiia bacterium]